ncbi:MAG: hypothetical protein IKT39_01335 [Clostridia bacterium]|nr:hypothetical protein [Clostridia bacterium]
MGGIFIDIRLELLKKPISEIVERNIYNLDIDANMIANTKAISMLNEIFAIIHNGFSSEDPVVLIKKIDDVFYKNRISGIDWSKY